MVAADIGAGMIRLVLSATALGVVCASLVAYQLREQVAYADDLGPVAAACPTPDQDAAECLTKGGTWVVRPGGGALCLPNLGTLPLVPR